MPPVIMVNMQMQKDVRTLQFITWVMALVLLFDLVSFWAVWFWPIVIVFCGLYLVYLVARIAKHSGSYYGSPSWLMFCLFILMFAGIVQCIIGVVLVAMEDDVEDTRRAFQYISLVTGPIITLTAFVWKTAIERVMDGAGRVGGGYMYNPSRSVAMDSRVVQDYVDRHPSLGGSRHTGSRGDYYDGPRISSGVTRYDGPYDSYGEEQWQQRDLYQREASRGRPIIPPIRSPPPIHTINQQPPTADVYAYENDERTGRPVLVSRVQPLDRDPFASTYVGGTDGNAIPARQYLRQQHMEQAYERQPSARQISYSKDMPTAFVPFGTAAANSQYYNNTDPFTIRSPSTRALSTGLVATPRAGAATATTTEIAYESERPVFGAKREPFASPDARYPSSYQGARQGAPISPNRRVSFAPGR